MPAADVIIKGSYEISKYKVTWLNEDGSILEEDLKVEYGSMPTYDGETPLKKADGKYTYKFENRTPEIKEVTEDTTYTAAFKATAIPVVYEEQPQDPEPTAPVSPRPVLPEEEPVVEVAEAPAPLAEPESENIEELTMIIEDAEVPQAEIRTWALYNLIAMLITILISLGMAISFFTKKKEEEEENENYEEEDEKKNKSRKSKFSGLIVAIVSIILFILTEDLTAVMVLKDRYTLLMIAIALFNLVLAFITRNRKKERKEEEEELQLIEA